MKNYIIKAFFVLLPSILGILFYINNRPIKGVLNCPKNILKISKKYNVSINKVKTLQLNLDSSLIVNENTMIQFIPDLNELVMNDKQNNRLLIYRLSKGVDITAKILNLSINKKGFQGFYYKSKDSIYLYDYTDHTLYLTNSKGVIVKKFTFEDTILRKTFDFNPSLPYISNMSPLIINGDEILATGFMDGEHEKEVFTGRTIRTRLNTKTREIKYDLTYPKIYEKRNWGGEMFRSVYSFYNDEKRLHILSFPADHDITVINERNEISYFPAYSNKHPVCNQPLNMKKSDLALQKRYFPLNHFLDNVSYRGIIYDKFNELYYRFTELPEGDKDDIFKSKKTIMLIFDKEFNYVAEFDLPKYLLTENSFVTSEGIFFLNTSNKNENIAEYEQYKITKTNSDITLSNK